MKGTIVTLNSGEVQMLTAVKTIVKTVFQCSEILSVFKTTMQLWKTLFHLVPNCILKVAEAMYSLTCF